MWECSAPLDAPFRWASFQLSRTVISNAQFHDTSYGTVFPGVLSSLLMLRADCSHLLLIADATLGWAFSRWAALTYRSIVTDSGIHNDAGVRRAIEEAMAATLIEVQTSPSGTLYAIHRRYWVFAKVQPKWHLYKRVPYDPAADPLDESLSAITTIA